MAELSWNMTVARKENRRRLTNRPNFDVNPLIRLTKRVTLRGLFLLECRQKDRSHEAIRLPRNHVKDTGQPHGAAHPVLDLSFQRTRAARGRNGFVCNPCTPDRCLPLILGGSHLHSFLSPGTVFKSATLFLVLSWPATDPGGLGALLNWVSFVLSKSRGHLPGTIFSLTFLLGFTTAIRYARAGIRQRLQLQEITAKQLQTELALLKAQINPHFLFNTLNNLYAMALRQEDPATAQGIAKLSHLMRYVIHECNVDRIELAKEVEQIRGFIELQKLRFSEGDDIRIDFEIGGTWRSTSSHPCCCCHSWRMPSSTASV